MSIDFTCLKCGGSFECDIQDLVDGSETIECPHCDARPPQTMANDFIAAVADLRAQISALSKKFELSLSLSTEELEVSPDDFDDDEDEDDDYEDELDDDDDEEDDYEDDDEEDELD